MIMRVVTLLRGLLSSLQVDVSSAQLWRPLALQVGEGLYGRAVGRLRGAIGPPMEAGRAAMK
jgi:hypothetical protein